MKSAFTLIELLIVIAILGVLAAATVVAINPGKRLAQGRDAQRRQDTSSIAYALASYYTSIGEYPQERVCDTSKGGAGGVVTDCRSLSGTDWGTAAQDRIYRNLVMEQEFLKRLPTDPINSQGFYYRYEPASASGAGCTQGTPTKCDRYWIGARIEAVDDPTKLDRIVFRCSDDTSLAVGAGCKEVEFPVATGPNSFDDPAASLQ